MITDAILGVAASLFSAVLSVVPSFSLPEWLVGGSGTMGPASGGVLGGLATVMGFVGQLSYWIPVHLLAPALIAVFAAMNVGLLLRIGRVLISLLTGGGGSAG